MNRFLKGVVAHQEASLKNMILPPLFVYQTTRLPQVLALLRKNKEHMAIITDEYGGTQGIITLEDILEQIVGEIQDETDSTEDDIIELPNGELSISGHTCTSRLLELIGIPEDDFHFESNTVGGWMLEMIGEYPSLGAQFEYKGFCFRIVDADMLRVNRIQISSMT